MLDGGSQINYYGNDYSDALITDPTISGVQLRDFSVYDKRTTQISGYGIMFDRSVNFCLCERLLVQGFPTAQIFLGSTAAGSAGDCMRVKDSWINGNISGCNGIEISNCDNTVVVEGILSDLAGGGAVVYIHDVANDQAAIRISDIKHETSDTTTNTIKVKYPNYGNLSIYNIIQRTPNSIGSPVIKITGTQGGKGIKLYGICGDNHNTWGEQPCIIYDEVSGGHAHVWETISNGNTSWSGRTARILNGDGSPENLVYGNAGDLFQRTDGYAQFPALWYKGAGENTKTNWSPFWQTFDDDFVYNVNILNGGIQSYGCTFEGTVLIPPGWHSSVALIPGPPAGVLVTSQITYEGFVTVTIKNESGSTWNPGDVTFRMRVYANS